jgi:hypothetical protein
LHFLQTASPFLFGTGMATLREVVKSTLNSDVTLAAILTGGVEDSEDRGQDGGSADHAPRDVDGVTILPHAVIRWRASNLLPPQQIGAEEGTFEVYVYDDIGYATIESALSRIKTLLNLQYLQADDRGLAHVRQIYVSGELPADELGGAPCMFSRFAVVHVR